jgi:HMGL-like
MPVKQSLHLSELALTLGNWGRAPLTIDQQRQILKTLANWSDKSSVACSAEIYAQPAPQLALIEEWISGDSALNLIVREDPRSDRLKRLAKLGAQTVVIDIPVSQQTAIRRFRPKGIDQVSAYAARVARDAQLAGLTPELALIDVARANKLDLLMIVDRIMEAVQPHGGDVRWRLVDSTGWADPIAGSRLPRSLAAWVRLLTTEFAIPKESITVQCADTLGFAIANTIAGARTGASVATSLLGLGMGCGWGTTEVVLAHLLGVKANTKKLLGLRHLLMDKKPGSEDSSHPIRDNHRPVSGPNAWQFPGGAAPEKPSLELLEAHFPIPPKTLSRHDPEPLLTSLSGHAGLLHLMHREWPDHHFQTEDGRAIEISQIFEKEFAAGRQIPVSWAELKPMVVESGVVEDSPKDD